MAIYVGPEIVRSNLVLYFDAANPDSYINGNTVWKDMSGYGNDGTLYNGITFDPSNYGSLLLDGNNDYIENSSPNLNVYGDASITLSCWFYYSGSSSSDFNALLCYGNGPSAGDTFALGLNGTGTYRLNFQFNGGNFIVSNNNVYLPNTWYNFVGTKTPGPANTTAKLYLNGSQLTILSATTITPNVVPRVFRVGRWTNDGAPSYYKGRVSEVKVYDRALTESEIIQNFDATKMRYGL